MGNRAGFPTQNLLHEGRVCEYYARPVPKVTAGTRLRVDPANCRGVRFILPAVDFAAKTAGPRMATQI